MSKVVWIMEKGVVGSSVKCGMWDSGAGKSVSSHSSNRSRNHLLSDNGVATLFKIFKYWPVCSVFSSGCALL